MRVVVFLAKSSMSEVRNHRDQIRAERRLEQRHGWMTPRRRVFGDVFQNDPVIGLIGSVEELVEFRKVAVLGASHECGLRRWRLPQQPPDRVETPRRAVFRRRGAHAKDCDQRDDKRCEDGVFHRVGFMEQVTAIYAP